MPHPRGHVNPSMAPGPGWGPAHPSTQSNPNQPPPMAPRYPPPQFPNQSPPGESTPSGLWQMPHPGGPVNPSMAPTQSYQQRRILTKECLLVSQTMKAVLIFYLSRQLQQYDPPSRAPYDILLSGHPLPLIHFDVFRPPPPFQPGPSLNPSQQHRSHQPMQPSISSSAGTFGQKDDFRRVGDRRSDERDRRSDGSRRSRSSKESRSSRSS
ncbi:hypothetical protein C8R47DRAFT_1112584 [Mycena vitilis]|nr:hypothetical protein C8R47DRAFT_1112584 [Mycena vitilis]